MSDPPKPERAGETLAEVLRKVVSSFIGEPCDHDAFDYKVARAALDRAAEIARSHRGMDGPHRSQLDCGWDMACDEIAAAILAFKEGR